LLGLRRGSGCVALFHRRFAAELHAAFVVNADAFDPDRVAHFHDILDLVHAEVREFGDVAEAVLAGQDFDKGAEFFDRNNS
jgi:hypothetical protein